ncbi:MAG: transglutaminaseTgpA domain-containing protein [Tetrasphaera sp.]
MTSASLGRSLFMSRTQGRDAVIGKGVQVDIAMALLTALVAVLPWMGTFDGLRYLAIALVGAVLGVGAAGLAILLGRTWLAVPLAGLAYVLGAAVIVAGGLPGGSAFTRALRLPVSGWKILLTTVPPVDGSGVLTVLPYLLALVCASGSYLIARSSRGPWAPVVPGLATFVLTVVTGTLDAWQPLATGLACAVAAVGWASLRRRRRLRVVGTGAGVVQQAGIAAALLAASGLVAWVAGPHLPGAKPTRFVLRTVVDPPFDVSQYPSPLMGIRNYSEKMKLYWDEELLRVSGMPDGSPLRLAVLDYYSGHVWTSGQGSSGAGGVFRRVGRNIRAGDWASSTSVTSRITVTASYSSILELNMWVPNAGPWTHVQFDGDRSDQLRDSLRYNTETGQGVVPVRLGANDVIVTTARLVRDVPKEGLAANATPLLDADSTAFVDSTAEAIAGDSPILWTRLMAMGNSLKGNWTYNDGAATTDENIPPGHSVGRLTTFLEADRRGSPEQFTAAYALMANDLGMPTRVVLGAFVRDGTVHGRDVRPWVEMQADSGEWLRVPDTVFMGTESKKPDDNNTQQSLPVNRDLVPPPLGEGAPGAVEAQTGAETGALRSPTRTNTGAGDGPLPFTVPPWVRQTVRYGGPPTGGLALLAFAVAAARGARRYRRRTIGSTSHQLAAGWRDLVDHTRDLGVAVNPRLTRQEQARVIGRPDLAGAANRAVFGHGDPDVSEVSAYWSLLTKARRDASKRAPWYRRLLRPWNPRSFLVRDPVITTEVLSTRRRLAIPALRLRRASN